MPLIRRTLALALCLAPLTLRAQLVSSIDAGTASLPRPAGIGGTAFVLAPSLRFDRPLATIEMSAAFASATTGSPGARWDGDGSLRAMLFTPERLGLRAELGALARHGSPSRARAPARGSAGRW